MKLPDRTDPERRKLLDQASAASRRERRRTTAGDPLAGLPRRDRSAVRALDATVADLVTHGAMLDERLAALRDLAGGVSRPGAVDPAQERASNPTGDERPERTGPNGADPEGMTSAPTYSDPVGEQILTPDGATVAADALRARVVRITREIDHLLADLVDLAPMGRPTSIDPGEVRQLHAGNERRCCENCTRVNIAPDTPWECTAGVIHTDVNGRLKLKWLLCRACIAQIEKSAPPRSGRGVLPGPDVLARHRDSANRERVSR